MALAALAILGQRSAHSFPIGPVIAEPGRKSKTGNKNGKEIRKVIFYITKPSKNGVSLGDPVCAQNKGFQVLAVPFISPLGFTMTPALSAETLKDCYL